MDKPLKLLRNQFLILVFVLFAFHCIEKTPINLSKFFYNLPIDSCISFIKTQTRDLNLYKPRPSEDLKFMVNTNLLLDNNGVDSVIMKINCFGLATGGIHNQVSPISYEQWLTNTIYLNSDSAAFKYFLSQKTLLDPLVKDPYLKENTETMKWIYSFNTNVKRYNYRQIHLTYEKGTRQVSISYRIIFNHNECNCD